MDNYIARGGGEYAYKGFYFVVSKLGLRQSRSSDEGRVALYFRFVDPDPNPHPSPHPNRPSSFQIEASRSTKKMWCPGILLEIRKLRSMRRRAFSLRYSGIEPDEREEKGTAPPP